MRIEEQEIQQELLQVEELGLFQEKLENLEEQEKNYINLNLYINCTKNNTRYVVTDMNGQIILTKSIGFLNIPNGHRKKPYNVYTVGYELSKELQLKFETNLNHIIKNIYLKGFGPGRFNALRGFSVAEQDLNLEIDNANVNILNQKCLIELTTFPHNGCRPKKARRLKKQR